MKEIEGNMLNSYQYDGVRIDSVDLKCLVVSRGLTVDRAVYKWFSEDRRLNVNPLTCNCMILSDGTVVQLTDMGFHLKYLSGILSWNNLKLLRYASQLTTPFSLRLLEDRAALYYKDEILDFVTFPEPTDFYRRKTSAGLPFAGNAVLQGLDWVAFQCLWACEFAAAGKPCEFCFCGGDFETLARKGKPLPKPVSPDDFAEIVAYAADHVGMHRLQITGGSTFDGKVESEYIINYLSALSSLNVKTVVRDLPEDATLRGKLDEILLYITPPTDTSLIDQYFSLGADRIACSLEVWDEAAAKVITPGKINFTTRERHIEALSYIADRYGPAKAFTNFILGLEEIDTLKIGAEEMARRGVLPTAAVWMPMGRPVLGSMTPPDVDFYRRAKELFAELYRKYGLRPPESRGLNVCIESDIWKYSNT
jgi:hypothetical protein